MQNVQKRKTVIELKTNERLVELREEKGIRQADLCRAVGIPQTTLSNYETGDRELCIEWLVVLANYFGVGVEYMLGLTTFKNGSRFCDALFIDTDADNKCFKIGDMCSKLHKLTPLQRGVVNIMLDEFIEKNDKRD